MGAAAEATERYDGRSQSGSTGADDPPAGSGARLSQAIFLYVLVVTLIVTLAPFRFGELDTSRIMLTFDEWFELVANVLLFLPLGFLLPLIGRRGLSTPLQAMVAGLALSTTIELLQLFEPARYTSPIDVLANGLGAATGAAFQRWVAARLRVNALLVGRLSLELPLAGLLYLLLPLLWVSSLAVDDQPLRLLGVGALGLLGARLLGTMQRYHFGPAGALGTRGVGFLAGGYVLLGAFPAAPAHLPFVAALAGVAACAAIRDAVHGPQPLVERRFEAVALQRAAPLLAGYLMLLVCVPLLYGTSEWNAGFGIPAVLLPSRIELMRLLETSVALTCAGYALAEAHGRLELSVAGSLRFLVPLCSGLALTVEISRGVQPEYGASVAQLGLLTAAGVLGGWIYHAQRTHVQALLASAVQPGSRLPLLAPTVEADRSPAVAALLDGGR